MLNRKVILWLMALVVIVPIVVGAAYWLVWDHFFKYQPVTITHNQAEIQKLLDQVDYVSPGRTGQPLYVVTYRSCQACRAFEEQEFPKYDAVNADTRVIPFALGDSNGLPRSTVAERSTIAELWISRKWPFYQAWFASSDSNWKADGLVVADNDMARTAVVGASRSFISQLDALLAPNNVHVGYPLVIWRDPYNRLKVCSCTDPVGWGFVRGDFNAPGMVGPAGGNALSSVLNAVGISSSASSSPSAGTETDHPTDFA
ncbi:MAG: hypothetical protein ACXU8O_09210, partial [Asticcacaulis sp.]